MLWDKGFNLRRQDRDARCWESVTGCMIVNELAQTLGLSLTKFKADMKACHVDLTDGMRDLTQFGISSTPTFFINGRFVSGALPSYQFESLIEEELAKAEARIAGGSPRATYYKDWVMDKGLRELEQTTVTGTPGTTLDP